MKNATLSKPLTRQALRVIREDIETAVNVALAKHGMNGTFGRITFTPNSFRVKLTAENKVHQAGQVTLTSAPTRDKHRPTVGDKFRVANRVYQVTGFNFRRYVYPVSAIRLPDGKRFKFPMSATANKV